MDAAIVVAVVVGLVFLAGWAWVVYRALRRRPRPTPIQHRVVAPRHSWFEEAKRQGLVPKDALMVMGSSSLYQLGPPAIIYVIEDTWEHPGPASYQAAREAAEMLEKMHRAVLVKWVRT